MDKTVLKSLVEAFQHSVTHSTKAFEENQQKAWGEALMAEQKLNEENKLSFVHHLKKEMQQDRELVETRIQTLTEPEAMTF
ncbi:hypothetical protein QYM36_002606 [Artemia franciscana]|uniref:Uncharacterized protein n=1 Tax=Artemia franciscana TaxID=6661 RepID=A0AA88IHV1_ARTSF|nr:hypothetical protein QYM36_002606 [Artemia franciscana]